MGGPQAKKRGTPPTRRAPQRSLKFLLAEDRRLSWPLIFIFSSYEWTTPGPIIFDPSSIRECWSMRR